MMIFGIDFTSAPRPTKPITCAACELAGQRLSVMEFRTWASFDGFESFLDESGPGTAAIDFPFGQPRRLIESLAWPKSWNEYVHLVGQMQKADFIETINQYREQQPVGDKHHLRATDKLAGSCSPMMLYGVPVGKMFYEGAPRLQQANVSVVPCRPNDSRRVVIEGYPALVVRNMVGDKKYKSEKGDTTANVRARKEILRRCQSSWLTESYGISLNISTEVRQRLVADAQGDLLDALLCAVQAAAFTLTTYGHHSISTTADSLEGWIADPTYGN